MKSTRLTEIVHLYESDMSALYSDFLDALARRDKKLQSAIVRKFLKVVRALNRDISKPVRSRKSMSGSRIPPEWFSWDANDILHEMWTAKVIDELAIVILKRLRKQGPRKEHAALTASIKKTRLTLKARLRKGKADIMKMAPDFWQDAYEEDFKKYLTR